LYALNRSNRHHYSIKDTISKVSSIEFVAKFIQLERLTSDKIFSLCFLRTGKQLEDFETGRKSSQCRFFKMKVLDTQKAQSINETVQESLDKRTIVLSDKGKNYVDIADYIEGHVTVVSDKHSTNTTLRWVHTAISNAKRILLGIYHLVKRCNVQRQSFHAE
jgi:hypothetical protein